MTEKTFIQWILGNKWFWIVGGIQFVMAILFDDGTISNLYITSNIWIFLIDLSLGFILTMCIDSLFFYIYYRGMKSKDKKYK